MEADGGDGGWRLPLQTLLRPNLRPTFPQALERPLALCLSFIFSVCSFIYLETVSLLSVPLWLNLGVSTLLGYQPDFLGGLDPFTRCRP